MDKKALQILQNLVGEFSPDQIENLRENLEAYIHPHMSVFVPVFKYCEYAVSPDHSHPGYSFIYNINLNGKLLVNSAVRENPIKGATNICAFSPGVLHQEIIDDGFSNYLAVFINKKYFESKLKELNIETIPLFEGHFFPPNDDLLFLIKMFMDESGKGNKASQPVLDSIIALVCTKIIQHVLGISDANKSVHSQDIADRAISFMFQNLEKKITVDQMAASVNMSASHFSRMFKKQMQVSPVEYLLSIRIEKAKRLLKYSKLNLTDIAFDCGFSSSSYFSHTFIEHVGLTPSEYRSRFFIEK